MATPQTFSVAPDNTTDTAFRAWGSALSAALQAVGPLTKTSDTGQINWATVTAPASPSAVQGYEIYRFNDTLQATAPIFLRVEYGASSGSATRPQLWLKVGTATDGAGTLSSRANTNVSVTATTTFLSVGSVTTATNSYVNGDASSVVVMLWPAAGTGGGGFLVERGRAYDGSAHGDGFMVGWITLPTGGGVAAVTQTILQHNQIAQPSTSGDKMVPYSGSMTTGVKDSTMYTIPVFTGWTPRLGAPSVNLIAYLAGDLANGQQFSALHYGQTSTFLALGNRTAFGWPMDASSSLAIAVRIS